MISRNLATRKVPMTAFRWERHRDVVAVIEVLRARLPSRSETADIEAIIDELHANGHLRPGDRVIYRDTEQRWDEVAIDAECRFAEFRPLGADTAEAAIAKLQEQAP